MKPTITKLEFIEYKKHFDSAINHCHELLDNSHFDTDTYELMVDNLRVNITQQFTNRLNDVFTTQFFGTDEFFETFGSLHEIDYDSIYFCVSLYEQMITKMLRVEITKRSE